MRAVRQTDRHTDILHTDRNTSQFTHLLLYAFVNVIDPRLTLTLCSCIDSPSLVINRFQVWVVGVSLAREVWKIKLGFGSFALQQLDRVARTCSSTCRKAKGRSLTPKGEG